MTRLSLLPAALGGAALAGSWLWLAREARRRRGEREAWRRAEADLRRAREDAEEASRAKDLFLATMSHEVRTPMNGVLGMIDLVSDGELSPDQREYLDLARVSARSLLRVINEILDVAKAEAGRLSLEPAPFALRGLVASVAEAAAVLGRAKGLTVTWWIDSRVPDRLVGDAGRLRQVLTNLLGNAVKFTDRGGVTLEAEPGDDGVRFAVRDTGPGIPPDRLPLLFKSFTQVDASLSRRHGGTGLGLAISRLIVEKMGGTIGVESREGEGSTFTFCVPLPTDDGAVAAAGPPSAAEVAARRGLRVLVAEDDEVSRRVALELLGREGYDAEWVADGRAALKALKRGGFDAAVLDVQLPEVDGLDLVRQLRRGEAGPHPRLPVVGVTAFASEADRERCLAAGMDAFVPKPVERGELVSALARAVEGPAACARPGGGYPGPEPMERG